MKFGASVSFEKTYPHLCVKQKKSYFSKRSDGLFLWHLQPNISVHYGNPSAFVTSVSADLLHKRLGHRSLGVLRGSEGLDVEIVHDKEDGHKCEVCELSKHHAISIPKETSRDADKPFELVYVDFVGPLEEASLGGARYGVVFTDEYTRYIHVYSVEFKDSFLSCLRKYLRDVKALGHKVRAIWGSGEGSQRNFWDTNKRVEGLRTDRGGEFISEDVKTFCQNAGIKQSFTGPYAPQQQGISERRNKTV
jgi:hypothetical protein